MSIRNFTIKIVVIFIIKICISIQTTCNPTTCACQPVSKTFFMVAIIQTHLNIVNTADVIDNGNDTFIIK